MPSLSLQQRECLRTSTLCVAFFFSAFVSALQAEPPTAVKNTEGSAGTATTRRYDPNVVSPERTAEKTEADKAVPEAGKVSIPSPSVLLTEFKATSAKFINRKSKPEPTASEREAPESIDKGTSSSSARKAAIAALPLQNISPDSRARVNEILGNISYFRRLPTLAFAVDPDVYQYLVNHPDVTVSIWRAMKIAKLQLWQTGKDDYEADAGDGSSGTIEVLHRGADKSLVLCEGLYKSPLMSKAIQAKSLLMLHTSFIKEADGTIYATHRADLFVSFPSQTIEAATKVLSPLTTSMTDRSFSEISLFLKMMSLAMARRPDWVEHIVNKMDGVPEVRRNQMLLLTAQVYTSSQKRKFANAGIPADSQQLTYPGKVPTPSAGTKEPVFAAPASTPSGAPASRIANSKEQSTDRQASKQ